MTSNELLDKSKFSKSQFIVKHVSGTKKSNVDITIYDDDTIRDVLIKLAVESKQNITSNHIFAWMEGNSKEVIPLGFTYQDIKMDQPYITKNNDKNFVDTEGDYKIVKVETTINKLIEWYLPNNVINYTTLYDYIQFLKLDPNKASEIDIYLFNGKIRKYWPRINDPNEFFHFNNSSLVKSRVSKIKTESIIYERNKDQVGIIHNIEEPTYADKLNVLLLSLTNSHEDNNVHLFKLFNDMTVNIEIPFSKITLENYEDTYCKLLKDTISYKKPSKDKFITKELFIKWFRSQKISIPNLPPKFMDIKNSLTFKLYKDEEYVTLLIYSNGLVKLIFNDKTNKVLTPTFMNDMIKISNDFLKEINTKKIYSEKPILLLDTKNNSNSWKDYFDSITSSLIYPVKDYQINSVITLFKNLSAFVRFDNAQETIISCIYKRIGDYDTIDTKLRVITKLHNPKKKLNKEQIITELEKIFNISEEEANEELEQWVHLSEGGKIYQKDESGIEFTVDIVGTNIKVDISPVNSFTEFTRICKFINSSMKIYLDYNQEKKDPHNLFKQNTKLNKIYDSIYSNIDNVDDIEEDSLIEAASKQEDIIDSKQLSNISSGSVLQLSNISDESTLRSDKPDSDDDSEDSEDSDDSGPNRLESSESEGGGYTYQKGGYNVQRYYLNRLNRYDKELFSGYSLKQHKHTKQDKVEYTYARKCGSQYGRQPIAITKAELDNINAGDEGEGVSFYEAVNIDGRDPNIYYICPKYWDLTGPAPGDGDGEGGRPRDPTRVNEFKDYIVDNNAKAAQKKNTDKYILRRDEGGYWKDAGDDIERYSIELWDDVHPDGYRVPCCRAPRSGVNKYPNGWEVDVLLPNKDGKLEWKIGTVESSTKTHVKVNLQGHTKEYHKKNVRNHKKVGDYITDSFPCDLGSLGDLNHIIKQLVGQDLDTPSKKRKGTDNRSGLVRKGIKRGSNIGDNSLLSSIQEILSYNSTNNSSVNTLIKNIIDDLRKILKEHNILSIGNGTFVNKFKKGIGEMSDIDISSLWVYIKKKININKYSNILTGLSKSEKVLKLFEEDIDEIDIVQLEINKITSVIQFEEYLLDETEIILDEYVIPVLVAISKFPSKTFGYPIPNLSIIVFEGNISEDVSISPPMGGFEKNKSESMLLLYKERGHFYEPIIYKQYEEYKGIITKYDDDGNDDDKNKIIKETNKNMENILNGIQGQIDSYVNDNSCSVNNLMDASSLTSVLNAHEGLTIEGYIYDNYNKIIHVKTNNNVLLPVKPTSMSGYKPLYYLHAINESDFPTYKDVLEIFTLLKDYSGYDLHNATISVVVNNDRQENTYINEIILESGNYIPVKKEKYDRSIHKLNIISINSYKDIDHNLGIHNTTIDEQYQYSLINDYKKNITELFLQKAYMMLKIEIDKDSPFFKTVKIIKDHDIKLRYHKSQELYKLLDKEVKKIVILKDEPYDLSLPDEDKYKLIIRNIGDIKSVDLYKLLLKYFIELLIIYDERDYNRFLKLDINFTKLKQTLTNDELLITYSDVRDENYLEYFRRYSEYIRNVSLYGEGLTRSKIEQLYKQKNISRKELEFVKKYPVIIHTLFGRDLTIVKYANDNYSELALITELIGDLVNIDEDITIEKIKTILSVDNDNHILTRDDLEILTNQYKIGFCLVTTLNNNKLLSHDVILAIDKDSITDDIDMILLYQYEGAILHILKKEGDTKLGNLKSKLFRKHLNKLL